MAASVDDFLRNLLRGELLTREQLRAALHGVPQAKRSDAAAVADVLVGKNLLSSFQAKKLLAGITLGLKLGPYLIQMPIGKGGMGTVYLAKDTRSNEMAALKVLSPQRAKDGQRHLARFQREMMLSQKIHHPGVALTKDVGEFKGVHYLVLEYIPGVTLHRLVARDGPLSPPRAARLFAEVCAALDHAHRQGLIHRDLKPTNIMVTPEDQAKVLDLGLALMIGEKVDDPEIVGGQGYIVGSVEYIAPEQTYDPTQVDGRADLYALGCTLYFALTGRGPFSFGTVKEKINAHRKQDAEPIRKRNPTVPEGLANIVHRLIAKDPALRPATAAIARQELLAFSETPAPPRKPGDSAIQFELVEEAKLGGEPDTLSEVFQFSEPPPESSSSVRENVSNLFDDDDNATAIVWMILGGFALVVLTIFLIVLIKQLS